VALNPQSPAKKSQDEQGGYSDAYKVTKPVQIALGYDEKAWSTDIDLQSERLWGFKQVESAASKGSWRGVAPSRRVVDGG